MLRQDKETVEEILKVESESKLFKMFLLSKDRMLLSFDEELVLIDYEKKEVLST